MCYVGFVAMWFRYLAVCCWFVVVWLVEFVWLLCFVCPCLLLEVGVFIVNSVVYVCCFLCYVCFDLCFGIFLLFDCLCCLFWVGGLVCFVLLFICWYLLDYLFWDCWVLVSWFALVAYIRCFDVVLFAVIGFVIDV